MICARREYFTARCQFFAEKYRFNVGLEVLFAVNGLHDAAKHAPIAAKRTLIAAMGVPYAAMSTPIAARRALITASDGPYAATYALIAAT